MKRRTPPEVVDEAMPLRLQRFRAEEWPGLDPVNAEIQRVYARFRWRRARGLPGWTPREVVDRSGR